jgi:hypothetical protein
LPTLPQAFTISAPQTKGSSFGEGTAASNRHRLGRPRGLLGYSKLVRRDEAGTLAQLRTLQKEVIGPAIAKHVGRLFKAHGDGFLVEFVSAAQAVEAVQAIQQANAEGDLPLRIGIHVGDVVVQGDDLMGDSLGREAVRHWPL